MINFDIKPGAPSFSSTAIARLAQDRGIARILSQSISDIMRKYRAETKRHLTTRLQIPAGVVGKRVKTTGVSVSRLRSGQMRATLFVGTWRIPLVKTMRRGTHLRRGSAGLVAGTKRIDKISLTRGSFLAKMPTGKTGVYIRSATAMRAAGRDRRGRVRRGRLPIAELKLDIQPAAEQVLSELVKRDDFLRAVADRFDKKLRQYANG